MLSCRVPLVSARILDNCCIAFPVGEGFYPARKTYLVVPKAVLNIILTLAWSNNGAKVYSLVTISVWGDYICMPTKPRNLLMLLVTALVHVVEQAAILGC